MTTPDIITPVSGSSPQTDVGGSWETGVYQYNSTVGTKEIYSLSFPQADGSYTNMGINTSIYVETSGASANTWYDYTTTSDPLTVTDTGTQIKLYNTAGNLMVTLPKPTTASWISTGSGGTSAESASTTSATLGLDSNGDLAAFVTAGSPSGDFTIYEGATLRNSFTHTTLTPSLVNATSWSSTNSSTWYLKNSYGDVLDTYGGKKKVFCNFW
jgi:hypothetical protein